MITFSSSKSEGHYEYGVAISFDEVEYFDLVITDYQVKITVVNSINVVNTTMGELEPIKTTLNENLDLLYILSREISDELCKHDILLWPIGTSNHLDTLSKLVLSSMEKNELTSLIANASSALYASAFNTELVPHWELSQKALDVIDSYFDIPNTSTAVMRNITRVMK